MTHRAKNVVEGAAERTAAPALHRGATALTYAVSADLAGRSAHRGNEHDLTGSLREKLEVTPGAPRTSVHPHVIDIVLDRLRLPVVAVSATT